MILVDGDHLGLDTVPHFQVLINVFDIGIRYFWDVYHSRAAAININERAKIGDFADLSFNYGAYTQLHLRLFLQSWLDYGTTT